MYVCRWVFIFKSWPRKLSSDGSAIFSTSSPVVFTFSSRIVWTKIAAARPQLNSCMWEFFVKNFGVQFELLSFKNLMKAMFFWASAASP